MTESERLDGVVLTDLCHRYGAVPVLEGVTLRFARGKITALVGENGAGKSTLLKILGGAVRPTSGEFCMDGFAVDLDRHTPARAQRMGLAVVQQEQSLADPLSVAENIFLGHEYRTGPRLDRHTARRRASELLARLGSDIDPSVLVGDLSLAERQLVEIAKALSFNTGLVAFDEPSAVLGGAELGSLFQVIRRLAADGIAIVYVSHRMDEIFELCERYAVLRDGKVVGTGEVGEVSPDGLVHMMVGRPVDSIFPAAQAEPGPIRLDVQGLSVVGKVLDANFTVRAGEIVGIAGLSGAGRSTLAKALFGAVPAHGSIAVDGTRVGPFSGPRAAIRAGIAYLPEDRKAEALALSKPVRWNLTIAALNGVTSKLGFIRRRAERQMADTLSAQLGIKVSRGGDEPVAALSGGNQQKVVLGRWLQVRPKVLILDEPTRGVDVGAKEQIYKQLRELTGQGLALLVVSSELIEVLGLSDRIIVMAAGSLVGELSGESATEAAVMSLITTASLNSTAAVSA